MLETGLIDGVGVTWMVGRAEEEKEEVARGEAEEIRVEAAVGDTKAEEGGDTVGLVNSGEWDTELGVGVYCGVDATDLEAGVRVDVMEEDGKDAEEGKDVVRSGLGGKGVNDVMDEEWGALVRETKVGGKLVGREIAGVRDAKGGAVAELWGTEEGLHPDGEVCAVVNEE